MIGVKNVSILQGASKIRLILLYIYCWFGLLGFSWLFAFFFYHESLYNTITLPVWASSMTRWLTASYELEQNNNCFSLNLSHTLLSLWRCYFAVEREFWELDFFADSQMEGHKNLLFLFLISKYAWQNFNFSKRHNNWKLNTSFFFPAKNPQNPPYYQMLRQNPCEIYLS